MFPLRFKKLASSLFLVLTTVSCSTTFEVFSFERINVKNNEFDIMISIHETLISKDKNIYGSPYTVDFSFKSLFNANSISDNCRLYINNIKFTDIVTGKVNKLGNLELSPKLSLDTIHFGHIFNNISLDYHNQKLTFDYYFNGSCNATQKGPESMSLTFEYKHTISKSSMLNQ